MTINLSTCIIVILVLNYYMYIFVLQTCDGRAATDGGVICGRPETDFGEL